MLIWLKSKGVPLWILLVIIPIELFFGLFLVEYELRFMKWYWLWVTGQEE